jgi:hypothetical protein
MNNALIEELMEEKYPTTIIATDGSISVTTSQHGEEQCGKVANSFMSDRQESMGGRAQTDPSVKQWRTL